MNLKDYFQVSFLNIKRNHKKINHFLVILILTILSIGLLTFRYNIEKLINYNLSKDIGYRSVITGFRTNAGGFSIEGHEEDDQLKLEKDIEKDIEEVSKIDHVLDAFNSRYWSIVLTSNLANENIDGTVTLLRGTQQILPSIIVGRTFDEGEKNVAICPLQFYPNSEPMKIDKEKIIDGRTLLNSEFTVNYNNYMFNEYGKPQKNENFEKTFKIIGLYDTTERLNDNSTCYVPENDIVEISSMENDWNKGMKPTLTIIIDDVYNVDYVIKRIEELGFNNISLGSEINKGLITAIRVSIFTVFLLILCSIIILSSSYAKKKINSEEKKIGMLRTYGYSKKVIIYLYTLELFLINMFIFLIGAIAFLIIYLVLVNNVPILITMNYIMGGISIGLLSMMYAFLIIVILPSFIILFNINKKCSINIIKLTSSEE